MCGNNPFRVEAIVVVLSQGFAALNPGLEFANAFGVIGLEFLSYCAVDKHKVTIRSF